ncbi:MAG: hypothetical protein K0U98_21625 [Deltaproteobacteria bacterium]|nr:hypothetical protein [Deltaproteobacteria bacterium]
MATPSGFCPDQGRVGRETSSYRCLSVHGLPAHGISAHGVPAHGVPAHCVSVQGLSVHRVSVHRVSVHRVSLRCGLLSEARSTAFRKSVSCCRPRPVPNPW